MSGSTRVGNRYVAINIASRVRVRGAPERRMGEQDLSSTHHRERQGAFLKLSNY
jgi:hypothetical protein